MKIFKSKDYWYGVYKNTILPVLRERVESNDDQDIKWDNAVLDAVDFLVQRFFGPSKK